MDLNRLKGSLGDKLNATFAAIAYNLRTILRIIYYFIIYLLVQLISIKDPYLEIDLNS